MVSKIGLFSSPTSIPFKSNPSNGIDAEKADGMVIKAQNATKYGITPKDFAKFDINSDGKLTFTEAQAVNNPSLLSVFRKQAPQKTDKTQGASTNPINNQYPDSITALYNQKDYNPDKPSYENHETLAKNLLITA